MNRFLHLFGAKEDSTLNISTKKTFGQQLMIERCRSHRNGHSFNVVIFNLKALRLKKKNMVRMIDTINCQIHDYDHIGWYGRDKIGVILPYTSAKEAKEFFKNIMDSFNDVEQESNYTIITFPPEKKLSEEKSIEYMRTG